MQKWMVKSLVALSGSAILTFVVGCSSGNPFGTVKVTGVVKLDGKAVEGATVIFQPDGSASNAATGNTDASGAFTLTTGNAGDGAVPGNYKVSVFKTEAVVVDDLSGLSPEEAALKAKKDEEEMLKKYPDGPPPPADLLPVKYRDPEKSGLKFEVSKDKTNHFEINLTKGD